MHESNVCFPCLFVGTGAPVPSHPQRRQHPEARDHHRGLVLRVQDPDEPGGHDRQRHRGRGEYPVNTTLLTAVQDYYVRMYCHGAVASKSGS
jgi:hypothetical protein